MNLAKIIDIIFSRYDKYLCIDLNSETSETTLRNLCDIYILKVREPTCFKNPDNPSYETKYSRVD